MLIRYNIQDYKSDGTRFLYLSFPVTSLKEAKYWLDEYNKRYKKPYPNGQGYYNAAVIVEIDSDKEIKLPFEARFSGLILIGVWLNCIKHQSKSLIIRLYARDALELLEAIIKKGA